MKRKILIGIVAILLIALTALGIGYVTLDLQAGPLSQEVSEASVETAVARIGDLSVFASGTGQVTSSQETSLSFDESGTLSEILVNIGDQVSAGDVLARLRVRKSEAQLAAEIAAAELAVVKNQQALDALCDDAEMTAAQALYDLETSQAALADLQNNDLAVAKAMQAVAQAGATVKDANMALYILNSSPSEEDIYTAYASLLFKEKRLNELKDQVAHLEFELKTAKDKPTRLRISSQLDRAEAQMYNQQIVYDKALYRYNTIDDTADPIDLNVAQTQMDAAQAELDQANQALAEAQNGAPAGDLAMAEAQVKAAQIEWEKWKDGPDPQDVALAETQLETAQIALEIARQESLVVDLVAPFDGTVMSIDAAVNQAISGGSLMTLADTSQMLLEVSMDESDYQSVQVGNRVEVTFDAFPDETFSGSIEQISPSMESTFGSQAIKALAVLDSASYAKPVWLPLGLSASVDVIAREATGAVLVPIEALHPVNSGDYMVYVQVGETFEARPVTVGLIDFTSAEITSGLQAGEIVAIGDVETE
ncbi:MAG: HlyD family efflux transporter periplasmic adaptor subunit [Anaerolineales bacterium]